MSADYIKIVIVRSKLLESLSALSGISAGESASLPILKNILLRAEDGLMKIACTNLDLASEISVSCKVIKNGSFTVPFQLFFGIVKSLTSERISLERGEKGLVIITDNYEGVLQGEDAANFPIIPALEGEPAVKIGVSVIRDIFERLSPATQFSEIRPEISGIFITENDDRLVFAATDSFRLGEVSVKRDFFTSAGGDGIKFIIPLKAVHEFVKVFRDVSDGEVRVFFDAHQISFKDKDRSLLTRRVGGSFPDYGQIIPKGFAASAHLKRQDLLSAVRLVSSFSGKGNDVIIRTGGPKIVEVYASQGALGENISRIPAKVNGEDFSVALNWRYVSDGLKMCVGDDVVLGVNSPDKPVGISSPSDPPFRYVVMPIKS